MFLEFKSVLLGCQVLHKILMSSYKVFDLDNRLLREEKAEAKKSDGSAAIDPGLNDYHAENFVNAILGKDKIHSPMAEAHKSVLLGHLGNIAAETGTVLNCNPKNGHILDNRKAKKLWSRQYEPGWKPKV